jgi:hypothetical protein
MNETKFSQIRPTTELIRTHAERLALEEQERAQKRRLELAEQRSDLNPPDVRIRAWERVHALRLPGDPAHPVLSVIAVGTDSPWRKCAKNRRHAQRNAPRVPRWQIRASDLSAAARRTDSRHRRSELRP